MSQNVERDRVKERMKKILARTEAAGCSEAEAITAMELFEKLSEQYDITMSEIDLREEPCIQITIDSGSKKRSQMDNIMVRAAQLCSVRYWVSGGGKNVKDNLQYHFFGMESDLERVKYYYEVLKSAMDTERDKFMAGYSDRMVRGAKRSMRSNFQDGFRDRMCERLYRMKLDRDIEMHKMQSTGTSLVLVKEQVVEENFAKKDMKLRAPAKQYHKRQMNVEANTAGYDAAGTVNINAAVSTDAGRNKLYIQ
jgi:hypothetical protein